MTREQPTQTPPQTEGLLYTGATARPWPATCRKENTKCSHGKKPQVQMVIPTTPCSPSCEETEHTPLTRAGKATHFLLPEGHKGTAPAFPTRGSFFSPRCPSASLVSQELFWLQLPQFQCAEVYQTLRDTTAGTDRRPGPSTTQTHSVAAQRSRTEQGAPVTPYISRAFSQARF